MQENRIGGYSKISNSEQRGDDKMLFKLKHVIFLCAAVLILLITSFITSYAGSVKYA
ncbi:MAG: hypothetical protein KJ826_19665 [Proteobacteria bacterium]|nr:hypothetical protein [Pseudomonadota bacterium]